jgi:hypothetical protein
VEDGKGTGGTKVQNRLKDLILGQDDDNDHDDYDNNNDDDNVYEQNDNDDLNLSWSNSKMEKIT